MEGESVEIKAPGGHTELENNKGDPASTKGSSGKKRKQREFTSPATDRPARERKSIERFIVSPDKEVKEFKIPKGAGTALKDIPNIVFKLSKRRGGDEVVQALHKVLFGRTSKQFAKANILQFSGYVWSGNEEREKAKIKERLERCVKESLFQISDILDLTLSKSLKKEDGVLKVFEFLESPYKTSDEETVKAKKSKKVKKTPVKGLKKKASGKSPRKSPKGAKKTSRSKKQTTDEEDESDAPDFEDDVEEEPEEKSDDDYAKESSSSKKRKRKSIEKESVHESGDEEETLHEKKKPIKEAKKGKKKPIQEVKKEKEPKAKAEKVKEPSDEDLQEAICELLQNADFSKVTFTDVMKQLGQKFNADLTHRKAHLKALIHEEIQRLVGEGENEDEDGNNEGEIDDNGDKANGDEQEEHEDASVGEPKADNEEEDGDENVAEGDREEEDGSDDEQPDGEDEEEEDGKSVKDKVDGEDDVEDAKEEEDHDAGAEEDSTDVA